MPDASHDARADETHARLEKSERSLRALIDHLPSGVLVHRGGRLVYANRTLASMLGCSDADELRGASLLDLLPPEEHATIRARVEALESGSRAYNPPHTGEMVRRDGSRVPTEAIALRVDFDGEPAVLATVRDLTRERDMLARAAVADRMRSVGVLAAGVAHEINNPLAYVLANVSLLADDFAGRRRLQPEQVQRLLEDAREGAGRVRDVVRDLRALSRAEDDVTGAVEVREVLESCIKMAGNEVRFRARLVADIEPTPPVRGNASRLAQAFLNLLVNAAHAIPEGHAEDHCVSVRARALPPDADRVAVEIADTGCGMPPEVVARIFEPFFTTKAPGVGTGLGLTICHGIVQSLGGAIDVESTPGRGSTFRVTLPAAARVEAAAEPPAAPAKPSRRARVLVVDDEPDIGTTIRILLEDEHDVVAVTSGPDALARLEAGERYDVVLCDLMMPGMSGIELSAALERAHPALGSRVAFLTGGAFTETTQDFLARSKSPLLEKPFEVAALRAVIARVVTGEGPIAHG